MSIASTHLRTRPQHRLTIYTAPKLAGGDLRQALLVALNSFTQSLFRDCNLILLRCLGSVSIFLPYFDSLTQTLINWFYFWNYLLLKRARLSVFYDGHRAYQIKV